MPEEKKNIAEDKKKKTRVIKKKKDKRKVTSGIAHIIGKELLAPKKQKNQRKH